VAIWGLKTLFTKPYGMRLITGLSLLSIPGLTIGREAIVYSLSQESEVGKKVPECCIDSAVGHTIKNIIRLFFDSSEKGRINY
jgi:hypothetical protein